MSGKEEEPTDVSLMKEAWLNEKNSPELLQYQSDLVDLLLAKIDNQVHMHLFLHKHSYLPHPKRISVPFTPLFPL
jgi:hypothetical protein